MSNAKPNDEIVNPEDGRFIWIDCEMTGLDVFHDELCEVAVVPTDGNLRVLDDGIDVIIRPSQAAVAHMDDFVRAMHTRSGLIDTWQQRGLQLSDAQARIVGYVQQFLPAQGKALLAGNSIGSDKKFLDRFMPELMGQLHYRVIDVSTFKELSRQWYPSVFNNRPEKHGGHRALADIIESIDELRYYRETMCVPEGIVDDERAKESRERIENTSLRLRYEEQGKPLTS